jgi:hypothetical protein
MSPFAVTIVSSLLSGLLGVLISSAFYERLERRRYKRETVRRLLGARFDVASTDFKMAMNEIPVVFSDSKKVMAALEEFWQELQTPQKADADPKMAAFLRAVCEDVGVIHKGADDKFFLRYFSAQPSAPADGHWAAKKGHG